MKLLLLVLAVVAVANARPPFGPRRGPPPPRPCYIRFSNGTVVDRRAEGCLNSLFACESVDLNELRSRLRSRPPPPGAPSLDDVAELEVCKPVSLTFMFCTITQL